MQVLFYYWNSVDLSTQTFALNIPDAQHPFFELIQDANILIDQHKTGLDLNLKHYLNISQLEVLIPR